MNALNIIDRLKVARAAGAAVTFKGAGLGQAIDYFEAAKRYHAEADAFFERAEMALRYAKIAVVISLVVLFWAVAIAANSGATQ